MMRMIQSIKRTYGWIRWMMAMAGLGVVGCGGQAIEPSGETATDAGCACVNQDEYHLCQYGPDGAFLGQTNPDGTWRCRVSK